MGKKSRMPKVVDVEQNSDSEVNSDDELANAFERGELQPGLNTLAAYAKTEIINDSEALEEKLQLLSKDLPWIERMDLTNEPIKINPQLNEHFGDIDLKVNKEGMVSGSEKQDKVQHDFKREMLFYRQAQAAVLKGIPKLKTLKVLTKRPEDYYAQMVKTDAHMKKVRLNLVQKQESMEKSAKAKKMREMKKIGKQVQHEVLKKRQEEKKEILNQVKKFRKGKIDKAEFETKMNKSGSAGRKRLHKNKTYGFGGPKKRGKYNTADSSAEPFKNKQDKFKPGKKKTQSRPGKARRKVMKSGK